MKWLDLTLETPAENLACDEALLDLCENEGVEILRFWEAREYFVVVGYGNRLLDEVDVEACRQRNIPILRRCSGGGTVVQGPGCLNYNLTLRLPESGPLTTVNGTNEFVMERNRAALEKVLGVKVAVKGYTDLAMATLPLSRSGAVASGPGPAGEIRPPWLKFSGNAQRRRRRALVFHGTILHNFDLALIGALLRFPSAQPDYRESRPHADFVRNIPARAEDIQQAIRMAWEAREPAPPPPAAAVRALVERQYGRVDWNERR